MTDIEQRIADIIEKHLICDCGDWAEDMHENVAHVASVLVSELGLKRELVWSRETGKNGYIWTTPMEYDEEDG